MIKIVIRNNILQLSIIVTLFLACNDNKYEGEVGEFVTHYRNSDDPLKLKAAIFIADNIIMQNCYKGELYDHYNHIFFILDSLFEVNQFDPKSKGKDIIINPLSSEWEKLRKTASNYNKILVNDIDTITSDYLINNLELAFDQWRSNPWSKTVSFDNFCEFVLPYKVLNEEFEYWRSDLIKKYHWLEDSIENPVDLTKVTHEINRSLIWFHFNKLFYQYPFSQSYSNLIRGKRGACPHMVSMATYAMRANGIPIAVDYVPQHGNRNANHMWNVLIQENKIYPFNGCGHEWLPFGFVFKKEIALTNLPKVFRKTFAIQKNNLFFKRHKNEDIPVDLLNPNYIDVSEQYFKAYNIKVELYDEFKNYGEHIYICVFDNKEWKPVHWGILDNGYGYFEKMGGGIVYIVMKYENTKLKAISDPFVLSKYGEIKYIHAKKYIAQEIICSRKYPEYLTAKNDTTNSILINDTYELMYWNKNDWYSLGEIIADDTVLKYEFCPLDALFLLHNNSRGKQERIFTYENDKQIWW